MEAVVGAISREVFRRGVPLFPLVGRLPEHSGFVGRRSGVDVPEPDVLLFPLRSGLRLSALRDGRCWPVIVDAAVTDVVSCCFRLDSILWNFMLFRGDM